MKLLRLAQTYLIVALPFVVAVAFWSDWVPEGKLAPEAPFALRALWEVLSYNLMLWFAVLVVFLVALVGSSVAREATLRRIADIRDRDEREEYLTGQAARTSYIATLAFGIFLLFLSAFRFGATQTTVSISMQPDMKSAFVAALLVWQLVSYRLAIRKLGDEE